VTVGRVETERQQPRHFAAAPNVATSRSRAIGAALRSRGWLPGRAVTVLSDGDPALVGLLGSDLEQKGPLRYADYDVSRLRHLIWNGYGEEACRALRSITDMAANAIWLNAPRGKDRIERFIQLAGELQTYLTSNATGLVITAVVTRPGCVSPAQGRNPSSIAWSTRA